MSSKESIVVVEDEPSIREVIEYNLSREGFRVIAFGDGAEGLDEVRREDPDLVLIDLMLPGMDGMEVCRKIKSDPLTRSIPVIIVSAKGEESDVVLGLGVGADDYIAKPFSPRELVARVRAVLRRAPLKEDRGAGERIVSHDLVIDASRHEISVRGRFIDVTATEFRLLHFLASHPGRVFTRDHLIRRVIGEYAVVGDRNIDVHVRALRRKLDLGREVVRTMRGVGYSFRDTKDEEEREENGSPGQRAAAFTAARARGYRR